MAYTLPALPYANNALEPHIDARTMEIHHTKHHQAYIDKLNAALEAQPETSKISLEELLKDLNMVPENIRSAVQNNGGGHFNHSFFWNLMSPNPTKEPTEKLQTKLDETFGSMDNFKTEFKNTALNRFGSGWAWLVMTNNQELKIISTANQDTPLALGQTPLLGIDVWEHAYYIEFRNSRKNYIDEFWEAVNWNFANENYISKNLDQVSRMLQA
jgi:Fe-Mn family superoxide dismutase